MTHVKAGMPLATLALILVAYSPALLAQAVQTLYSPVILVRDMVSTKSDPDARPIQMREDGSGFARVNSVGTDLSYVGGAGARYFIGTQSDPTVALPLPPNEVYQDFVAWHENGDPSTLRLLTSDHTLYRGGVRWSVDGRHIVYGGRRYDSAGNVVESGAYVGDVEWRDGAPIRVFNERLVGADLPRDRVTVSGAVLDSSAQRVALSMTRDVVDATGKHVRFESAGMFVAAVPAATEGEPLPAPATPTRIVLSRADAERGVSAFSPVPGDDRLLFAERESPTNPYVLYLWTVEVPQTYDGSYALTPTAVTTKSNSNANYLFSVAGWSPTGTFVVFTSARSTMWTDNQVYKIAANGKGKAIRLTNQADAYTGVMWRP
jgi:hypothetical protein